MVSPSIDLAGRAASERNVFQTTLKRGDKGNRSEEHSQRDRSIPFEICRADTEGKYSNSMRSYLAVNRRSPTLEDINGKSLRRPFPLVF